MKVTDVLLRIDTMECGYRIVETDDDRYAFVWGNLRARVGDTLDDKAIQDPTADRGIEVYDTYPDATQAWTDCAEALRVNGETKAANEMDSVAMIDRPGATD